MMVIIRARGWESVGRVGRSHALNEGPKGSFSRDKHDTVNERQCEVVRPMR